MNPLRLRLSNLASSIEDATSKAGQLVRGEDGEPSGLARGVAAGLLVVNSLTGVAEAAPVVKGVANHAPAPGAATAGFQLGDLSRPPLFAADAFGGAKAAVPGANALTHEAPAPALPEFQLGEVTVIPAASMEAFSSAQQNAHELFTDLATSTHVVDSDMANPLRAAPELDAYKEAVELSEIARPPAPPASFRNFPEYPSLKEAHHANTFTLDEAASQRVADSFATKGFDLSDEGLARFAEARGLPKPDGMNPALAEAVLHAAEGGERLTLVHGPLSAEGQVAVQALQKLPRNEVLALRRELKVPAPAGELGVQERVGGSLVIDQRLVDAFVHKLAAVKRHVTPGNLAGFKKASGLHADTTMDVNTARALVKASRVPPKPPDRIVAGYVNGVRKDIRLSNLYGDFWMRADAARAFRRMAAAAAKDGVKLELNSAFRFMGKQKELYKLYRSGKGNPAAVPGYSNHQGGLAVDIKLGKGVLSWLRKHGDDHGFKRTNPVEDWHWVYGR